MDRITVEPQTDPHDGSRYYRAGAAGRTAESDRVRDLPDTDVRARFALAAQAVARLGEQVEAAR
jgi:hypothetical protein